MAKLQRRMLCLSWLCSKRVFMYVLAGTTICMLNFAYFSSPNVYFREISKAGNYVEYQRTDTTAKTNSGWKQISIYDAFDRHKSRTNESCVNVCDTKKDLGCAATNVTEWSALMLSPDLTFIPMMSESEYIYPFEVDYLSQPPLTDLKQLPSLTLSKVVIDGAVNDVVSCNVGDVIKGRVDLVNGYGKQRILGGDNLRVWIQGGPSNHNKAVGQVVDLKNGSYEISAKCLWQGSIQLKIALVYPREYLRIVVHQIHISIIWVYAVKFRKDNVEEITTCYSTPNIPGRPCLCNLTETNQQSLYCGRPLDSRLGCTDWFQTHALPTPALHNATKEEVQLNKEMAREIAKALIPHNYKLNVSGKGSLPTLKSCKETSSNVTWDLSGQPSGYWTAGEKWESVVCQRPKMTSAWATSCLTNTQVWVFGDSNGFRSMHSVLGVVHSKVTQAGDWPYQFIRKNAEKNILFTFTPLEYPVYLGGVWRDRLPYGGVAKLIDRIPSKGAQVVMVHYYLHIASSHLSTAYLRMKAARDAIERLLNRNPEVTVGIRGPHVSSVEHDFNHSSGGDNLGLYLLQMTLDIFADLKHKVVFLDGWEMTIANENTHYHPSNAVPFELMRTLLAFKCS